MRSLGHPCGRCGVLITGQPKLCDECRRAPKPEPERRQRQCRECGGPVTNRAPRATLCEECRQERRKTYSKPFTVQRATASKPVPDGQRSQCRCGRPSLGWPSGRRWCGVCLTPSQLRKLDGDDWELPRFKPWAGEPRVNDEAAA